VSGQRRLRRSAVSLLGIDWTASGIASADAESDATMRLFTGLRIWTLRHMDKF
jgi:hypothetical protein